MVALDIAEGAGWRTSGENRAESGWSRSSDGGFSDRGHVVGCWDEREGPMVEKVTEATIDPKWQVATIAPEGQPLCVLTLDHPRHGSLSFILPSKEARGMSEA